MELKKKFKKIGFIFGLKREMNLVSKKIKILFVFMVTEKLQRMRHKN